MAATGRAPPPPASPLRTRARRSAQRDPAEPAEATAECARRGRSAAARSARARPTGPGVGARPAHGRRAGDLRVRGGSGESEHAPARRGGGDARSLRRRRQAPARVAPTIDGRRRRTDFAPACASSRSSRRASPRRWARSSTARSQMVRETVDARRHAVLLRQRRQRRRRAAHGDRVRRALHAQPARLSGDRADDRHVAAHRGGNDFGFEHVFARQVEALAQAGRSADHPLDERQLAERAARGRGGAGEGRARCWRSARATAARCGAGRSHGRSSRRSAPIARRSCTSASSTSSATSWSATL